MIQSKLLWGIWEHRDLSSGDTASYFVGASGWTESFHLDPVYSPLYTSLWGSLQWLVQDPYAVTILHRVVIALAASLLVLAIFRRLLSPGIAWALAVWWAVLPINYDTVYEVHLFALLVGVGMVLIALTWSGLRMRAAVYTVLLASTVLLRYELVIATVIWAVAWGLYEVREHREGKGTPVPRLIRVIAIPTAAVALALAAVIDSSPQKLSFGALFQQRASDTVCQSYAFGYEQRNHDYRASPFAGCKPLSLREFGTETPSLIGAIEANPGAMGSHFLWNARLVPYGLELMLFDRISAGEDRNPDYVEIKTGSTASLVGLIAVTTFVGVGLVLLWRDRRRWWESWVSDRAWGWLALGSLGVTGVVVMIWQHPRPSFVFGLSVFILATIGLCTMAYADRWPVLKQLQAAPPLLALLILISVPSHYGSGYQTPQLGRPGRPIHDMVKRLEPFDDQLRGAGRALMATYAASGCSYIGKDRPCKAVGWKAIVHRPEGTSLQSALDARAVDFVYADEADFQDPSLRTALGDPAFQGWRHLAPTGEGWILLRHPDLGAPLTQFRGSAVSGASKECPPRCVGGERQPRW
jgi:hypothetical protein